MDSNGEWSLAPAYDVTHAYNPQGPWTFQHLMGIDGKYQALTRKDLLVFAERHSVPGALVILNEINDAIDSWSTFASQAQLPKTDRDTIAKDFQRV
jgi:serine/threonine-protein kinase HipA